MANCESCSHYFNAGTAVCTSVDVNRHVERTTDRPVPIRTAFSICDGKFHDPLPSPVEQFVQINRNIREGLKA